MAKKTIITPYSIEECDLRINHWRKELDILQKKYDHLEPEQKKPLLHTTINLLKFWIGYKRNYYGKGNKLDKI